MFVISKNAFTQKYTNFGPEFFLFWTENFLYFGLGSGLANLVVNPLILEQI